MCYKLAKHGYSCMHAVSPPSLQLFLTLLDGAKFVLPRVKAAKKAGFFLNLAGRLVRQKEARKNHRTWGFGVKDRDENLKSPQGSFFGILTVELGGGNSNIFDFHPDPWGNDPIWSIFLRWVETTN